MLLLMVGLVFVSSSSLLLLLMLLVLVDPMTGKAWKGIGDGNDDDNDDDNDIARVTEVMH